MKGRNHVWLRVPFALVALAGCETADPTMAFVDNGFPLGPDADPSTQVTVYKVWWSVALFSEPVPPGEISAPVRVVPGTDVAYALLAPGWDPASGSTPRVVVPLQTTQKVSVERGETLRILIADRTTMGNCASGNPLSVEDATFIVDRIFPGDFAGVRYDPATCSATPIADSGAPDGGDGGSY
jgi:hypothetical protein